MPSILLMVTSVPYDIMQTKMAKYQMGFRGPGANWDRAWISKYIQGFLSDVVNYPCPNFNGG